VLLAMLELQATPVCICDSCFQPCCSCATAIAEAVQSIQCSLTANTTRYLLTPNVFMLGMP
jgi:hypothetical protein